MPPYLAIPHYHLSKLPITTKIAVTAFVVSLLAGFIFIGAVLYPERTRYTTRGAAVNFAGTEHLQERGVIVDQEVSGKTRRQLIDIVHPHSLLIPILFFILCHMMEMSYAPRGLKIGLYVSAAVAMLGVTFAPFWVSASLGLSFLLAPVVLLLLTTFAIMAVVPVFQMWTVRA